MARAVAYNLRYRVAEIERDIANAELEKSNFEMLPTLEATAGRDRNSVKISNSDDRIANTASVTFAWNILDLGVSYARANQQADEVLINRVTATVRFRWQDRLTGQDIVPQQTVTESVRIAESLEDTLFDLLFQETAQRVVERMQQPW